MSPIDYDALRGSAGGEPPDGIHKALLMVAKLVETGSGSTMLVTEWQVGGLTPYYWTTWFGFEGARMGFTQEFLDSLGVDRSQITDDDAFGMALLHVQGETFAVRTSAWSGGINTYVEEAPDTSQTSLDDAPIDTAGLPEVSTAEPVAAGAGVDDDIPF
jgi:hypothetical protein